jgi:hypothetical protein
MSKLLLLVGPVCAGKTKLAEMLIEKGFLKNKSNFYGIEQSRKLISDGTMAGELDAWASFLRQMQSPASNDNAIYEFSGTGRHVYSVAWSMNYAKKQSSKNEWLVVYCLASDEVIKSRFPNKVYDAPIPFNMGSPLDSVSHTNGELKKSWENAREWDSSPKLKFNMNVDNYDKISDEIIAFFNR